VVVLDSAQFDLLMGGSVLMLAALVAVLVAQLRRP